MIKEDYVSFEIAKLLKEKGFDVPCIGRYSVRSKEFHLDCTRLCNNGGLFEFSAPTLQMAMKWLREVHNIHIIIHRYPVKLNYSDVKLWYSEIITLTSPESVDKQFFLNEENDIYEAACESAIKYCLTNLI